MKPRLHSLKKYSDAKFPKKIARKAMQIYVPVRSVIAKFR